MNDVNKWDSISENETQWIRDMEHRYFFMEVLSILSNGFLFFLIGLAVVAIRVNAGVEGWLGYIGYITLYIFCTICIIFFRYSKHHIIMKQPFYCKKAICAGKISTARGFYCFYVDLMIDEKTILEHIPIRSYLFKDLQLRDAVFLVAIDSHIVYKEASIYPGENLIDG